MHKEEKNSFLKVDFIILTFILIIAFVFRLYKINTPLADLHSWRQVDTAAVARNFVKTGIDFLHPTYDDLSNIETGLENPKGYRFVEVPIYNAIIAVCYNIFPNLPLEIWGRLISSIFSLFIIGTIYYLVLKEAGRVPAIISSIIYAIFPFFVFFSRVVLPETPSLALAMISIFFLYLWSNKKNGVISSILLLCSLLMFVLSLLVKPQAIFYSITLLFLFYNKYRLSIVKKPLFYLYFIISLVPLIVWRTYIKQFPEGIPASGWLITQVNTYQGLQTIFFRPAFFRWIFYERINNLIFGGYLSMFFILGIISKHKRYVLFSLLISAFAYLFTFQGGNVQHEYYQVYLFPSLAIFSGLGMSFILQNRKTFFQPVLTHTVVIFVFIASFLFSYYRVKDYYNYPDELVQIAKVIKTLTKESDLIVTDRLGDTTLLYLTERKGAPAIYKDPMELKKLGYKYLVTLHEDKVKEFKKNGMKIIFENNTFGLFEL